MPSETVSERHFYGFRVSAEGQSKPGQDWFVPEAAMIPPSLSVTTQVSPLLVVLGFALRMKWSELTLLKVILKYVFCSNFVWS